jgi:hypothetical protein
MPSDRSPQCVRRSVGAPRAGRSLWVAAAWTGTGAAIVGATLAIVAVAVCWLPVSGATGRAHSAIHAGLLSFLAALHGGVTVDGVTTSLVPLGMTLAVALTMWRAGSALADTADELAEHDPLRLVLAGLAQAATFMITALIMVPFASLGTSSASPLGVAGAAVLLFVVVGGTSFVRSSPLRAELDARLPACAGRCARAAGIGVGVYLALGALLVAGSLLAHHGQVAALSRTVGGGWGGFVIALLGVLAAPNAVVAGAAYLAGPGFAFGAGTSVSATTTAHGTVPAFPVLGALPGGHGAPAVVWLLIVVTPIVAGLLMARVLARGGGWLLRARDAVICSAGAGSAVAVLAWLGGGAIGDGELRTIGAAPGWLGLAVTGELAAVALPALGLAAGWQWLSDRRGAAVAVGDAAARRPRRTASGDGEAVRGVVAGSAADPGQGAGQGAGRDALAG